MSSAKTNLKRVSPLNLASLLSHRSPSLNAYTFASLRPGFANSFPHGLATQPTWSSHSSPFNTHVLPWLATQLATRPTWSRQSPQLDLTINLTVKTKYTSTEHILLFISDLESTTLL